jgi:hypothetical protein
MDRLPDIKVEQIQEFYTNLFVNFHLKCCQASLRGEDFPDDDVFDEFQKIRWGVFAPLNYLENVRGDVGIGIYKVPTDNHITIACRIVTDGDYGWLLIFQDNGNFLTIGETDYPIIIWADKELTTKHSDSETLLNNYWSSDLPNFWKDKEIEHIKLEEIVNEKVYKKI